MMVSLMQKFQQSTRFANFFVGSEKTMWQSHIASILTADCDAVERKAVGQCNVHIGVAHDSKREHFHHHESNPTANVDSTYTLRALGQTRLCVGFDNPVRVKE